MDNNSNTTTNNNNNNNNNNSHLNTTNDFNINLSQINSTLVDFLEPLSKDGLSSGRFENLSKLSVTEIRDQIKRLEEWAYVLGVQENKHLQTGKLLGILTSPPSDLNLDGGSNHQNNNNNQ
ncbi:hypothetical protein CYY_002437 [Polysphondylium violaceum]|uniref:Uncharacterized protein n=1 Tax=Polysphondylium violaceum TaxID=133409 RepID=A0A8J4V9M2_9MYCE|nr:hypothetical protein CYY_002437 [Polysphondylium violaceum]